MRWHRPLFVLCLVGAVVVGAHVSASAQSASPTPVHMRIEGTVSGSLRSGGMLTVRSDVTMPGGWQGLHLVGVSVRSAGREIERLTYEVESTRLAIGDREVLSGTGAEGTGTYLRVRGPNVIVTTGGPYLSIQIHADVVRTLPQGVRFRLSVESDQGDTAGVTRALATRADDEGFGWDVVLAAALAALLVGAVVGNLVASRRRLPPKLSVYGVVQRRLDDDRRSARPEP